MKKNRSETIAHLFSLSARGIKYDLARMHVAVGRLGNPQNAYDAFHVAGTNGKGSTSTFIASILQKAGYSTGLYTSPHLIDFEERFMVNGRPVATDDWLPVYEEIEPVVADLNLTFFELTTLVCFELFRRMGVEQAVFETGMGGRLDATNVVVPRVGIITSLDIDHTDYLGPDRLSIAREKLGIVKQGVPLVMAEPTDTAVRALAIETCRSLDSPLQFISEAGACDIVNEKGFRSFRSGKTVYHLPFAGGYQITNALCAIGACNLAGIDDPTALASGIESAFLPARFQCTVINGKQVVFDVAHNPQAAGVLAATLRERFSGEKICFVVGMMKDKDIAGLLSALIPVAGSFVFTQPAIARACPARELPGFLGRRQAAVPMNVIESVGDAVDRTLVPAAAPVCICGSFYTVSEAMIRLKIRPFMQV